VVGEGRPGGDRAVSNVVGCAAAVLPAGTPRHRPPGCSHRPSRGPNNWLKPRAGPWRLPPHRRSVSPRPGLDGTASAARGRARSDLPAVAPARGPHRSRKASGAAYTPLGLALVQPTTQGLALPAQNSHHGSLFCWRVGGRLACNLVGCPLCALRHRRARRALSFGLGVLAPPPSGGMRRP
jgi:hypothetical protein